MSVRSVGTHYDRARTPKSPSGAATNASASPTVNYGSGSGETTASLAWTLTKVALWVVAVIVACALICAAVAIVIVLVLSAVVVVALGIWLRFYVHPTVRRVQIRILKWAALIGALGGSGLVYASFNLPAWFVGWANQTGGDVSMFVRIFGIVLASLPLASLALAKCQRPQYGPVCESSWHTGYEEEPI